jgi:hypothetical protein
MQEFNGDQTMHSKMNDDQRFAMKEAARVADTNELESEKRRRLYYQGLVYHVCNVLDRLFGGNVVCGTFDAPSGELQKRMKLAVAWVELSRRRFAQCRGCQMPLDGDKGTCAICDPEKTGPTAYGWVVEMQGPAYLSARHAGGYEFCWTDDHSKAIRFPTREQADLVMMAVRQLRGDLFPSCLTQVPRATEHAWGLS